jgi:hypothetical protein
MSKDDFKYIRWSLVAALAMILAGAALVVGTRHLEQGAGAAYRDALAKQTELKSRLRRARDDEQETRRNIERFDALRRGGIVGEEQRLDWVERIRSIKAARKLYDLQYEIAPRQVLDPAIAPGAGGEFEFLASTMRLQMQLLHEGDVLGFLSDLRNGGHAYLRPRSCVIERLAKSETDLVADSAGAVPQLRADCLIDWITIRGPKTLATGASS